MQYRLYCVLTVALLGLGSCSTSVNPGTGLPIQHADVGTLDSQAASGEFSFNAELSASSGLEAGHGLALRQREISTSGAEAEGDVLLDLVATTELELNGLFYTLHYDPEKYSPVELQSSGALSSSGRAGLLELSVLRERGKAHHGQTAKGGRSRHVPAGTVLATARLKTGRMAEVRESTAEPNWPTQTVNGHVFYEPGDFDPPEGETYSTLFYLRCNERSRELRWSCFLPGDYDQNGEVRLSDLSVIGQFFGQRPVRAVQDSTWPPQVLANDSPAHVADGNNDGIVSIQDVAAIGQNFGEKPYSFKVYAVHKGDASRWQALDYPAEPVASVDVSSLAGDPAAGRLEYRTTVPRVKGMWLMVAPEKGEFEGPRSSVAARVDEAFATSVLTSDSYQPGYELSYDADGHSLNWFYNLTGDYNLDNRVSLQDYITIGVNFHKDVDVGRDDPLWYVDGNKDGVISPTDLTPIGLFFSEAVQGYRVFNVADASDWEADPWAELELAPLAEYVVRPVDGETVLSYEHSFDGPPASGSYLFVKPVWFGYEGPVSEIIQVP